jgi:dinuclear metal center YbgI/SA1388 family protein
MLLTELNQYLQDYLEVKAFKDHCPNGLCVEGADTVLRGITGVSFSLELAEIAVQKKADFIVVHHPHGFWDNQPRLVKGVHKKKIQLLLNHGISLFGFHLPLDAHPEVGNNMELLKAMGLHLAGSFAEHGGKDLGYLGEFPTALSPEQFIDRITKEIGKPVHSFMYGRPRIKKVGICSGGAPEGVQDLIELGYDAYLTGEARETTDILCKEETIHFVAAGHHQTERFGPRALAKHLSQKLGLEMEFVDIPNPV